jgi:TonB family protein
MALMAARLPAEWISPPAPEINTPSPSFSVNAPPNPKPPQPPKSVPSKPQQATPARRHGAASQQAVASSTPQTMSIFQVTNLVRPNLVYPARAKRAGHQGTTVVRTYIDASRVPTQISVEKSSAQRLALSTLSDTTSVAARTRRLTIR